jgi:hypothetical protein
MTCVVEKQRAMVVDNLAEVPLTDLDKFLPKVVSLLQKLKLEDSENGLQPPFSTGHAPTITIKDYFRRYCLSLIEFTVPPAG